MPKVTAQEQHTLPQMRLDVLLKEIDVLQNEMDKRLDRHAQSFYFCTLLLAGVITGIATLANTATPATVNFVLVTLSLLPSITTPLAAMFFDDELMRGVADLYLHKRIAPKIEGLLSEHRDSIKSTRWTLASRHIFMKELGIGRSRVAATTRHLIFAIPFVYAAAAIVASLTGIESCFGPAPLTTRMACLVCGVFDAVLLGVSLKMRRNARLVWHMITHGESGDGDLVHK